jgi:CMP-N-acetylneuraminic acid synthetase
MINGQTVLAVIPCRSGSKRCLGKNFRLFRGRPLYEWSVDAALRSKYIDVHIVSRDEDRPPELCTDTATNEDVLRHHLKQWRYDVIVLLQPTSPLRLAVDIDACIESAQLGPCVSVREDGTKNGAVYVARADWIAKHDFSEPTLTYGMPDGRSLDIDYESQFE